MNQLWTFPVFLLFSGRTKCRIVVGLSLNNGKPPLKTCYYSYWRAMTFRVDDRFSYSTILLSSPLDDKSFVVSWTIDRSRRGSACVGQ